MTTIFFDLEGPLSPEDNAYNLMKLFSGGDRIFELISRYDDLLTLERKPGYEPGDTLALIAPFLICHGITEQDIISLAEKATLVPGSKNLIHYLQTHDWDVYCISTSYQQYALRITSRLNIAPKNVACTKFPLTEMQAGIEAKDLFLVKTLEKKISDSGNIDDDWIKNNFDLFYWQELPKIKLGRIMELVKPIGGQRKVEALKSFVESLDRELGECVAIGDSITDYKMINEINLAGGLGIAFNGNEYVLPYATMGLASTNIYDLRPVLDLWAKGDRKQVETWVRNQKKSSVLKAGITIAGFIMSKIFQILSEFIRKSGRLSERKLLNLVDKMYNLDTIGIGAMNLDHILMVDHIIAKGEQVVKSCIALPGGSAANTIYGLAKLGIKTGFIGAIGKDKEGTILINDLKSVNTDVSHVLKKAAINTGSTLCISDGTIRSIYLLSGANSKLSYEDIDMSYLKRARFIHMSSFADDQQFSIQIEIAKQLKKTNKISFAPGAIYVTKGSKNLLKILTKTYILFINQKEIELLTGHDFIVGARDCLNLGCEIVVVTLGGGKIFNKRRAICYILSRDSEYIIKPFKRTSPQKTDTTGAGDAFASGFLFGLLKGKSLEQCGMIGDIVANFAISKIGARKGLPDLNGLSREYLI